MKSVFVWIIIINAFSYSLMCVDKLLAINTKTRIPEKIFFLMAISFGSLGVFLAMLPPLRHKSSKLSFRVGIPIFIIMNIISIYLVKKYVFSI